MDSKASAKNLVIILLIGIMIASLIITYNLLQQKEAVEKNFSEYRRDSLEQFKSMNETINQLHERNIELRDNIEELNKKYQTTYQNYIELNQSYDKMSEANVELVEDLEEAFEKINTFRRDINSSLEWFKYNSQLRNAPQIKEDLNTMCIQDCTINLACIHLVNEQTGFTYKSDIETSGKIDRLQSLEDFIGNMGGDCEDFSLFFKAQYNYLKEECEEVTLKAYEQKKGEERFYMDFNNDWYLKNAQEVELDKGYSHPNVFCGKMYDYREDTTAGHCIVGFTDRKLDSVQDLKEIETAELIEPQNGMYYGKLNHESSELYILEKDKKPETFVNLIITNKDMLLYSDTEERWLSHSYFDEKLASYQERIK